MKPQIILDTDMDTDCDDAGAMAVLHALAMRGEAEILATVGSSHYPYSVPTVVAINAYYGRPDIPIGAPKGRGASIDRGSRYADKIASSFPTGCKTNDDAPDAVEVYRQILGAAADRSVTVVTIGYLTNLSALLRTEPDEHSDLNGRDLVDRKVANYVCMGSRYPRDDDPRPWGNFKPDPEATVHVAAEWPGTITFTGGGPFAHSLAAGKCLETTPEDNPVRQAYFHFFRGKVKDQHCADQIAVLVAVRGTGAPWKLETKGYNHIFENGTHAWRESPDDLRHQYISALADGAKAETVRVEIEALMTMPPTSP